MDVKIICRHLPAWFQLRCLIQNDSCQTAFPWSKGAKEVSLNVENQQISGITIKN